MSGKRPQADSEWIIEIRFESKGQQLGNTITMRYADAYLQKDPNEVGRLIGSRLAEARTQLT